MWALPYPLENEASTWYHSLLVGSITNWGDFKKAFLEKFAEEKTPSMLLNELRNLKMGNKKKSKDFNRQFAAIPNNFPMDSPPHDSITSYYYMTRLPANIVMFFKRANKVTLVENFCEALAVEKDLKFIGAITDKNI